MSAFIRRWAICNFLSAVVLRNGDVLTHPLLDSHSDLVTYYDLPDDHMYHQHFAKVELTPSDWLNVDTWTFRLDEATAPSWWDDVKAQAEATLRDRAKAMILTTGRKAMILEGCWILAGDVAVESMRGGRIPYMAGGTVQAIWGGTVQAIEGGTVQTIWGGTVQAIWGGTVQAIRGGTVQTIWGGTVQAIEGGTVQAIEGGTVQTIWGGTVQAIWGGTVQEIRGGTVQEIRGGTVPKPGIIYAELGEQAKAFIAAKFPQPKPIRKKKTASKKTTTRRAT